MTLSPTDRRAVLKVLKKARVLLVQRGWRPSGGMTDGPLCAWQALFATVNPAFSSKDSRDPLLLASERALIRGGDAVKIWTWNDRRGRTQTQVLARFDKAIARLEAHA